MSSRLRLTAGKLPRTALAAFDSAVRWKPARKTAEMCVWQTVTVWTSKGYAAGSERAAISRGRSIRGWFSRTWGIVASAYFYGSACSRIRQNSGGGPGQRDLNPGEFSYVV